MGVTPQRFERSIGMKRSQVLYYANRQTSRTTTEEGALIYDNLMVLLNERAGEIMGVRIELERRETRSRAKRVAEHARQGSYGRRENLSKK